MRVLPLHADERTKRISTHHKSLSYSWYRRFEPRPTDTARLFQSGRRQAVRMLKAYHIGGTEVIEKPFGHGVLLLPIDDPWQTLAAGLAAFAPGFQLSREQPEQQQQQELAP